MAISGALTTSVGLSAAAPATFNETGYEALNFTSCAEVISVGEFGREYETVRVQNLADGATRKFKGAFDNGTVQMEFLFDSADAGQTLIEAAETSTDPYYWKIGLPSGEEFYFAALVTSVKRVIGGPNDALMLRCTVEIDHRSIVEGT